MKKIISSFMLLLLGLSLVHAQEGNNISKGLKLPQNSQQYLIKIMNLNGKVEVTGHSGTAVELQAKKSVASGNHAGQLAKEWTLAFRQEGNTLLIYADGPGVEVKQDNRGEWRYNVNSNSNEGEVHYDIVLRVPDQARVQASTINGGDVLMQNLKSDAQGSNVNGGVTLTNMGGNVKASTVNGDLVVQSKTLPTQDTDFTTVNGSVRITFPPQLAANIQYTSVHGDFYTDYDVKASPLKEEKKGNGGTYYKIGGKSALQVGQGGPKIRITTVNGDMFLKKGG